jgi:DNA replication licensing factor MCM7
LQEIRIQELSDNLKMGSIPRAMTVFLRDDLTDACKAGDRVLVTGLVQRRWQSLIRDERCDVEIVMEANSIHTINADRLGSNIDDQLASEFDAFWQQNQHSPLKGIAVYTSVN